MLVAALGPVAGVRAAAAQTVTVRADHNVWLAPANGGALRRLTTAGRDTLATLSPDGRVVAFVRHTPGDSVWTGSGRAEATELWVVRTDGTGARRLVRGHGSARGDVVHLLAGLGRPQFAPNGRRIYVESRAAMVTDAVHVVTVETGAERFVCAGWDLEVVPRGRYAGDLLVRQHRYYLGTGSYNFVYLMTPTCREIAVVAGDGEAASLQLEQFHDWYIDGSLARLPAHRRPKNR